MGEVCYLLGICYPEQAVSWLAKRLYDEAQKGPESEHITEEAAECLAKAVIEMLVPLREPVAQLAQLVQRG